VDLELVAVAVLERVAEAMVLLAPEDGMIVAEAAMLDALEIKLAAADEAEAAALEAADEADATTDEAEAAAPPVRLNWPE
jgi:hypothetical protein